MKIGIVYSSITGNTKKVADAIFNSLEGKAKIFRVKKDEFNYKDFDIILIGYWCRRTFMDNDSFELLKTIKGKKIATFGTAGMYPDSTYANKCHEKIQQEIKKENEFIGSFLCQGKISEKRTEERLKIPKGKPHYLGEEGLKRHIESRKHPNEEDLNNAVSYFKEILKNHER